MLTWPIGPFWISDLPGHGAGAGALQRHQKQRVQRPRTVMVPSVEAFNLLIDKDKKGMVRLRQVKGEVEVGQVLNPESISEKKTDPMGPSCMF